MDLRPTDEQRQLREALRRLFDRRMAELVGALPDPPRHDARRDLADAVAVGLPGLGLPEDVGGAGAFVDLAVAHEELGRGLAGPLFVALATTGRLLLKADGADRTQMLTALADGQWTAVTTVDDDVAGGRRAVIGPAVSDVLVVGPSVGSGDATVFVVPTDAAALRWDERSSGCDLPSWRVQVEAETASRARLTLTSDALDALRAEMVVLAAARQLGGARAVLDRTIEHVKTREQFERPIGTFQAVQHQLADVATELDATELAVAQAAWSVDAALPPTEVRRLAALAALTAAAACRRATLVAHQLHGGMGFVLDSPLHLWSARAVSDPTVPMGRRQLLDDLATVSGITAERITMPPDHRVSLN